MSISRLLERARRKGHRELVTPRRIARLRQHPHGPVRQLGDAIAHAQAGELSNDERRWVDAVESRRRELLASTDEIEVIDYGAGFPADPRSEQEMRAGVRTMEVVGEACLNYSKAPFWAGLLFRLIRSYQPKACVELGTCLGLSAAMQAAALELNGAGRLITLEGSAPFARIAAEGAEKLRLGHRMRVVEGTFETTLQPALDELGIVDYAFIDGHHDGTATLRYFDQFLQHLAPRSMLVFDDISNYGSMRAAWRQICAHPRVDIVVDASVVGICVIGAGVKVDATVTLE